MAEEQNPNKVQAEMVSDPSIKRWFTKASFELNKVHGKWRLVGSAPQMVKVLEKKSAEPVADDMAQHAQLNEQVKSGTITGDSKEENPFAQIGEPAKQKRAYNRKPKEA